MTWLRELPVAHRGLHDAQLPENSLGAFAAAAEAGYAIEFDVRLSADGVPVVIHDLDTERVTGKRLVVAEEPASVLRDLRLDGTDFGIPTLAEAVAAAGSAPLLVEVKPNIPADVIGPAVMAALAGRSAPTAVQSFDPRVLLWLRAHAPDVPRGQLSGDFAGVSVPAAQKWLLRSMVASPLTRPQFIGYDIEAVRDASLALWRRLLEVPVLLWTVTTERHLELARQYDANVIFEGVRPGPGGR
ncbi:glycerophosphodiester phosphodiesterase family protein [Spongisporangium articulatum]|uniref:Glycerophosphodiester phosphodiesterase family protein n=1 Tax=Spongisporangium articulatum TaxID=3362603 RepID=A0ABW8AHD3_9ACTN